jgi:hypothetical protein
MKTIFFCNFSFSQFTDFAFLGARHNTYRFLFGILIGATGGFALGWYFARNRAINRRIVKSISCFTYSDLVFDNVTLSKTYLPTVRNSDVLIKVKAASISRIDVEISKGYVSLLILVLMSLKSFYNFFVS